MTNTNPQPHTEPEPQADPIPEKPVDIKAMIADDMQARNQGKEIPFTDTQSFKSVGRISARSAINFNKIIDKDSMSDIERIEVLHDTLPELFMDPEGVKTFIEENQLSVDVLMNIYVYLLAEVTGKAQQP